VCHVNYWASLDSFNRVRRTVLGQHTSLFYYRPAEILLSLALASVRQLPISFATATAVSCPLSMWFIWSNLSVGLGYEWADAVWRSRLLLVRAAGGRHLRAFRPDRIADMARSIYAIMLLGFQHLAICLRWHLGFLFSGELTGKLYIQSDFRSRYSLFFCLGPIHFRW